jgi:putative ABC transport system ATP-binding protein
MDGAAQIELDGVDRVFHLGDSEVHALRAVDLRVAAGEYLAVMGPSGSGKSTLLNILGLLDRPNAGTYRLEGRDVTTLAPEEQARVRSRRIGFVFQSFHLVARLTAAENVALPMMLAGIPARERAARVAQALADYGLDDRAHHRPDQLSGGQRQRVAIARATIMQPAVLLADEPTGNLDRATGEEVVRLLEELNAGGVTLIVVTHDQALGARAHRQVRMEDGAIVRDTAASSPHPNPPLQAGEGAAGPAQAGEGAAGPAQAGEAAIDPARAGEVALESARSGNLSADAASPSPAQRGRVGEGAR